MSEKRIIKKYANRKMYDMTRKGYISLDQLSELIKAGEEVSVVDNKTGEDITGSVVSQLLVKEKANESEGEDEKLPSGLLIQLLRKGGGTVVGYARNITALWQSALTMAEDEVDKLVKLLVKDSQITESEGSKLKKEILGYAENFKVWIGDKIDQRINEVLGVMNLATKEQVMNVTSKIEELTRTVERLEKMQAQQQVKEKAKVEKGETATSSAGASDA